MSKHKILQDWIQQFLDEGHLYFESTQAYPSVRAMVPNYGDYLNRTDILGYKYKSYTFLFIGYEQLDDGESDVNANNLEIFDEFLDWIEEQEEQGNYPNFGENCSEYSLVPLQNMATIATITEEGLAKYILGIRIDYKEE